MSIAWIPSVLQYPSDRLTVVKGSYSHSPLYVQVEVEAERINAYKPMATVLRCTKAA